MAVERVSYRKLLMNIAFLCSSSCLSDLVCILSLLVRIITEPNTLPDQNKSNNYHSFIITYIGNQLWRNSEVKMHKKDKV